MNGQVGCQPGDGVMDLLAPIAICLKQIQDDSFSTVQCSYYSLKHIAIRCTSKALSLNSHRPF